MGAGGRDFHNFNVCYRDDPAYEVVAFTAAQIPFIETRTYPASLAGNLYPGGIPIYPEKMLSELIRELKAEQVVFAYSDVTHVRVMHAASEVMAMGAEFTMLGPDITMLGSKLPVISVCAVRTGSGKSPVTRKLLGILRKMGKNPSAIRHPMAYCDLEKQRAQRFATMQDMDIMSCTVEEREEYEPIVEAGFRVYAGVDYAEVLRMAEGESDIIVWDGGNNDFSFIRPDLEIVVADALRPSHCMTHHPGETNIRRADVVVINKADRSTADGVKEIKRAVAGVNPAARIITARSRVEISPAGPYPAGWLNGKRVLVVEDGPTLTHGGMAFGAGIVAARVAGAIPCDPRPYAKGSIRDTFAKFPHLSEVLPAMGYSDAQKKELAATIREVPCDAVVYATPVDLTRLLDIVKPAFRVTYEIRETGRLTLTAVVREFIGKGSGA